MQLRVYLRYCSEGWASLVPRRRSPGNVLPKPAIIHKSNFMTGLPNWADHGYHKAKAPSNGDY